VCARWRLRVKNEPSELEVIMTKAITAGKESDTERGKPQPHTCRGQRLITANPDRETGEQQQAHNRDPDALWFHRGLHEVFLDQEQHHLVQLT
jgi:hypothetical protein